MVLLVLPKLKRDLYPAAVRQFDGVAMAAAEKLKVTAFILRC